ncbi:unnamed protein product, partial [Staurois parvus]
PSQVRSGEQVRISISQAEVRSGEQVRLSISQARSDQESR